MKTLLVIASESGLAAAVRTLLDPSECRVVACERLDRLESFRAPGMIDALVIDADLTDVRPLRMIDQVTRIFPSVPIVVYTAERPWEWEEDAYIRGVDHVLAKPVRGRLLRALIGRLWQAPRSAGGEFSPIRPPRNATGSSRDRDPPAPLNALGPESADLDRRPLRSLEVMREFSGILAISLCSDALLKKFLLQLREVLGVNRAALFLLAQGIAGIAQTGSGARRLRSACALGLAPTVVEHLDLTLDAGIGGYLQRTGRILKRDSEVGWSDREIAQEFELLGAEVAIPILDRESLLGVAVFDGRVTGESYSNEELALVFHLLEELGLAIRNSWLHDQMAADHQMMTDVLHHLGSACVVIGTDLNVIHANPTAIRFFLEADLSRPVEFSDLPQTVASRAFEVLKKGTDIPPFMYRPRHPPGSVFQVTVKPFKRRDQAGTRAVLVLLEDRTQSERSHQLELEAANLRLIKSMAEHLAHEIGNSLVPISTFHQVSEERKSAGPMGKAVGEGIRRISRLTSQMLYLAQDGPMNVEAIPIRDLIDQSFDLARTYLGGKSARLDYDAGTDDLALKGDPTGLKHALAEIVLNALQSSPGDSHVQVSVYRETEQGNRSWLHIEVRDRGAGFSHETARRCTDAFYSTRNVGLGLGLTVAKRIIEDHHQGRMRVIPASLGEPSIVRVSIEIPFETAEQRLN